MPPVIWGQTGDGVTPSTFPLLVAPNANGKSKALVLPGVAGNYASSPDVNLLDADTAHMTGGNPVRGGGWYTHTAGNTMDEAADATSYSGTVAKATNGSGTAQTLPVQLGTSGAGANPIPVSSDTTYSFIARVKSSEDFPAVKAQLNWYNGATYLNTSSGTSSPSTGDEWEYRAVTATAPSTATHVSLTVTDASSPDGASLSVDQACLREGSDATFIPSTRVTGDIDIRAHVQIKDVSAAPGSLHTLVSKDNGTSQRSYGLAVSETGQIRLYLNDGTTSYATGYGGSGAVVDGVNWIRATFDASTGDVTTYTSDDGASWTQRGAPAASGLTSIAVTGEPVQFGLQGATLNPLHGAILHAEVRDGIDGPVVAEFDADDLEAGNENLLDADTATLANSAGAWNDALADVTYFPGYLETSGDGTNRQLFVIKAGGSGIPVSASTTYYFSADVWTDSANALTSAFRATMYNGGSIVGGSLRGTGGGTSLVQNQWTRITGSITMEATVTNLQLDVVGDTAADANGETFRLRNVRMSTEAHTTFVYPNGSGLSSETGNVIATYRTGDATAECVDRACWQFTGSEWLEIADRDALNFGTGDFTVAAGLFENAPASSQHVVSKKLGLGAGVVGWGLRTIASGTQFIYDDGTTATSALASAPTYRTNSVYLIVREGADLTSINPDDDTSVPDPNGSLDNSVDVHVGNINGGEDFKGLISWVAIWPRALTASERTELAAWDGRPGSSAPGSLYGTVLYLNAADTPTQTAHANAEVNNSLSSLVHPQMGSAAMRARKREIGANAGSRLWDITVDEDGDAIPDADEFHPRYLDGKAWWFEAGSVQANDGDAVSVWRDISGNGRDATQATGDSQPTLVANGLNGRAVVRFDGVDDTLQTATGTAITQPNAMFVVGKTSGGAYDFLVDGGAGGGQRQAVLSASDSGFWQIYGGVELTSAVASDANSHIFSMVFDGASSELRLEGVSAITGDAGALGLSGMTLGSRFAQTTGFLDGDIAEVIVFDRTLTTAEMNGVGNYLASKYGLTWTEIA